MTHRDYTAEQRAEAIALAASVGPVKAARRLGIPVRTVTNWTHRPEASPIIAAAERSIAEKLVEVHNLATDRALAALRDPSTPARDVAAILRVAGEQANLATGRATQNVDMHSKSEFASSLTDEQERDLRQWLDMVESATDAELATAAAIQMVSIAKPDRQGSIKRLAQELADRYLAEEATE